MSYFAKLENNIVTKVIVAEVEFFQTFVDDTPGQWLETKMDGSIRKNYAGIGFTYAQDWQEDCSQVVRQDPEGNLRYCTTHETIPVYA
jgi:hypothetical protein